MGRSSAVILAAAVLGAFALGLLLGRVIFPAKGSFDYRLGEPLVSSDAREGVQRDFQEPRGESARRPGPALPEGFAFMRLVLDTSTDAPKACFQFTEKLDASGKVNYADFVRLTPATKPVVEVNGQNLCLSGLAFDQDYRAILRAGLPSAAGKRLDRPVEVAVAFGDKPSYVGFVGDGVVLPRLEADGLGIETVNVEKIEVTVRRVSDRALARKEIVKGESLSDEDYLYIYEGEDGEDVGA
ncbi:MAG: hypothetical protein WD076_05515, partial [Parvularculaceae bacterium]